MMIRLLAVILAAALTLPVMAQDVLPTLSATDADLATLKHKARPVMVFADTPDDPAFAEQMRLLSARASELAERDVIVIADTDPAAASAVRAKLRPRGFMLVLMDKDGLVALRKPFPWDGRELIRAIDRMPDRREEMRNKRAAGEG